jgi:hypothetical protein
MRDLTEWFQKNKPEELGKFSSLLLQLDANVPAQGGVALAGGYLRDLYFGKAPKDMDFVFYGLNPVQFLAAVTMWFERIPGEFSYEVFDADYNGNDTDILSVVKVTWEGQAIDLILYNSNSITGALQRFDHSLNEFYATYDSDFRLRVGHRDGWGVCTRNPYVDLTQERVDRMREYARYIDWEYVA